MIGDKSGDVTYARDLGWPVLIAPPPDNWKRAWSTPSEAEHLYDFLSVVTGDHESPAIRHARVAVKGLRT